MFCAISLPAVALTTQPLSRRSALATAALLAANNPNAATAAAPPSPRRVYVAGATGRTGRRVLDELLRTPGIEAIAGVRGEAAIARLPPATERLVCDLTAADAQAQLSRELLTRSITDVIYTVGFSPTFLPEEDRRLARAVDYLATVSLIQACEAAKLPGRFVLVSSLGVNATGSSSARLLDESLGGVLGQKRQAEDSLRASRLEWVIVRPGLLQGTDRAQGGVLLGPAERWVGDAEADRAGLGGPVKCASPFLASSGAVCAATRLQVAQVCVAALGSGAGATDDDGFSRRVVEVVARPDVPQGEMRVVASVGT